MSSKKKVIWVMGVFVVFIMLLFALYQYYQFRLRKRLAFETAVEQAVESRVHVGDLRDQTVLAMQDVGAWYHGTCTHKGEFYEDIYVFGPKNKREAIVWDIYSDNDRNGNAIIYNMGTLSESMEVPEECSPPEVWFK